MNHVKKYSNNSFWQSETWKNILISSGQALRVETFSYQGEIIFIEFRTIGLGQIGAFSLGVGSSLCDSTFYTLGKSIALRYGAIFWQIEYMDDMTISPDIGAEKPYKHFIEPYTRIIDLSLSEEAILAQMHEKGRYHIRIAEKHGVTITRVPSTRENIDIWMRILEDTTSRGGFAHNSQKYYEAFLGSSDRIELIFAYYGEVVIAAGIFVYTETTVLYYYGASVSDREMRKHMASYLLQWYIIRDAKSRGCIWYDFLGVAAPDDTGSHLSGVTSFKEKFGGDIVKLGPKVLFPLSWKYRVFSLIRKIKNRGK